jgi:predicted nuclease of restriction endonuclease-like (RecB) superfamily
MGDHLHRPGHTHPHPHSHSHLKKELASRREFISSMVAMAALAPFVFGQEQSRADLAERFRQMSEEYEAEGLAGAFRGITTNGSVVPNLFEIGPTGASTEPVRNAAEKFIASLTGVQLARTMFPVDDIKWRKWMNQHFYARQGISFQEMTETQRDLALGLMRASLSESGFALTRNIMRLNETLAELADDHEFLGEWLYFITIMGRPSATEPWGWQLDGHHAIINYFVIGDQVVMTPHFMGSEPVKATSGKYKGVEILQKEQNDGLQMLRTLPEVQRRKAVLNFSKTGNNNLTEAFKDNAVLDYAGIRAADLEAPARKRLVDLVHLYVSNLPEGHARVKMNEVQRHIDDTWFAWIGESRADSVFYYRVQSPVVLIEFDHQRPANLRKFAADPNKPTQQHVHCVVRTPNGNDYGKDILRQHYLAHPHKEA